MIKVEDEEHFDELLQRTMSGEMLVVHYHASWEKKSNEIAPFYEDCARDFCAVFAQLDIDKSDLQDVAMLEGLKKVPYFLIYQNGEQIDSLQSGNPLLVKSFCQKHLEFMKQLKKKDPIKQSPSNIDKKKEKIDNAEMKNFLCNKFKNTCEEMKNKYGVHLNSETALQLLIDGMKEVSISETSHSGQRFSKPKPMPKKKLITELESVEHLEILIKNTINSKPLVIDVYATWCAPCKRALPTVEKCAQEYNATFAKLNFDHQLLQAEAKRRGLTKLPFFFIFKNGKQYRKTLQHSQEPMIREFLTSGFNDPSDEGELEDEPIPPVVLNTSKKEDNDAFEDVFAFDDDF